MTTLDLARTTQARVTADVADLLATEHTNVRNHVVSDGLDGLVTFTTTDGIAVTLLVHTETLGGVR